MHLLAHDASRQANVGPGVTNAMRYISRISLLLTNLGLLWPRSLRFRLHQAGQFFCRTIQRANEGSSRFKILNNFENRFMANSSAWAAGHACAVPWFMAAWGSLPRSRPSKGRISWWPAPAGCWIISAGERLIFPGWTCWSSMKLI
jgi:hypothetical protein